MNQVGKALKIAYEAHKNQTDKAGEPYILHPLRVAFNKVIENDTQKVVAILHDVVEDSEVTFDDLRNMGFSEEIIGTLRLLTRSKDSPYFHYIRNIRDSGDQDAYWVKYADLEDNMDISRIPEPIEEDYQRLEKYKKAIEILVRNIE